MIYDRPIWALPAQMELFALGVDGSPFILRLALALPASAGQC